MAKVAVIGNIKGWSYPEVEKGLKENLAKGDTLISTGAKGVGTCVKFYAKKNGIDLSEILPNFQIDREIRYSIRNQKLVEVADKIIAFDKELFPTAVTDARTQAESAEKEVVVINNEKVAKDQLTSYIEKTYANAKPKSKASE